MRRRRSSGRRRRVLPRTGIYAGSVSPCDPARMPDAATLGIVDVRLPDAREREAADGGASERSERVACCGERRSGRADVVDEQDG